MTAIRYETRAAAWRRARWPETTPEGVVAKLIEEVGELARAVIAEIECRPGRGDVGDEAAQVVLVLASLMGEIAPEFDLLATWTTWVPSVPRSGRSRLADVARLGADLGAVAAAVLAGESRHAAGPALWLLVHLVSLHAVACPTRDLFADAEAELARHEAALDQVLGDRNGRCASCGVPLRHKGATTCHKPAGCGRSDGDE